MNRPRQRRVVLNNSADTLTSNSIDSTHIINSSILGTDISNGTISEAKLETAVQTKLNAGGGAIAPNSIDSTHIIDGSILGTDISSGTISLAKFNSSFNTIINTLINRLDNLDKFSIQRTLDVVVTSVNSHNINIDLSTYESVQIDFLLKNAGNPSNPLNILPVNAGSVGTGDEYNGTAVSGNNATLSTFTSAANNGTILQNMAGANYGFTASISCKIFKVYDLGNPDDRYTFTATGLWTWANVGTAKSEIIAMVDSYRPTALNISGNLMSFSYSIINDRLITSVSTITYAGTYSTGVWPNIIWNNNPNTPGIDIYGLSNMSIPLNLTFPAGSTRVRLVTSPSVNWLSNLPDFVPTAGQTTANITINKINPGYYDSYTNLQLVLNTNTNSSYNFAITVWYE